MSDKLHQSTPPLATKHPTRLEQHGDLRIDDYFWLRERENLAVLEYIKAENVYTEAMMAHTKELREQLYREMRGRIQEEDQDVPEQIGDYFYYERTEQGKQYPIHCRKQGSLAATEEILLDQNQLAEGHDFCDVGIFEISPDQRLLAFSVDYAGNERFTLQVKDLTTGLLLPDKIENTFYSVEWAADNRTLFYNICDEAWRPFKLFRHELGQDTSEDTLIFHEPDESYWVQIYKTKNQRYLIIHLHNTTTNEAWFIPADQPTRAPQVIEPRQHRVEYDVEQHGDFFLITTNLEAENFRVMRAPTDAPGKAHWQEVIPHRPSVLVKDVEPFRDFWVIHEREGGFRQIHVIDLVSQAEHVVEFPEPIYSYRRHDNPEFDTHILRFTYSSLTTPNTVFDYDMRTRSRQQRKQQVVKGGYDATRYETLRQIAIAPDGAQVPISIVRRKDKATGKPAPLFLYGYGSYGSTCDPDFESNIISLLDRGFVYAIAHVRGGGEMGRAWYLNGRVLHKKNTFTDFIACAEHLVAQGFTTPQQVVANGASAGGLLMGAITNLRPDLFAGIIAEVPFVDVISTVSDPTIPLTVIEWEEWGNPANPEEYAYMRSYSPYDNVEAKAYPHILATAGWNDSRVQYWEPAKWVAKLRTTKTNNNILLLKTNMGAGHGGSSGRFDYLKEIAFQFAFALDVIERSEKK
ncbi:MAG: S9 family peptidase [Caldilineaceae bacterium]